MILQPLADPAVRQGAGVGEHWFVLLMIAYALFYLARFFRPLLEHASPAGFAADLESLELRVRADAELQAAPTPGETLRADLQAKVEEGREALNQARIAATVAEGAGELERAAELRNGEIPGLETRVAALHDQLRQVRNAARRSGTDRLESLQSLRGGYGHALVREAVQQLSAQFPQGQYQRFDLALLPTVSAYSERLSAARTMAGVLLGLLGTMIKLNLVVAGIGAFTRSQQMQGTQFLAQMGELMQGIGGAFTNSISGVVLTVAMLVLVGHLNAGMQRRIESLDAVVSQKVVPVLAEIHHRHLPELALGDILRGTGDQLDLLNTTVVGLTQGMDEALNGLGRRIGEMLQQFGSYQKQYKQLNDWVGTLQDASTAMRGSAAELGRAASRVGEPIDEMNRVLREHLSTQTELQATGYLERILAEVRDNLEAGRREQEAAAARGVAASEDALRRAALAAEAMLQGAQAQNDRVQAELRGVAAALRATTGTQIGAAVERLAASTRDAGARMDRSAAAFAQAAERLDAYGRAPTFFFWLTQVAWPALTRGRRRRPRRPRRFGSAGRVQHGEPLEPDGPTGRVEPLRLGTPGEPADEPATRSPGL